MRRLGLNGGPHGQGTCSALFSQERWDKLKASLTRMRSALGTQADRKKFLSARGFMVYASVTYLFMRPFMKGMHMLAESWRGGRDAEGWKVAGSKPGPKLTGDDQEYSEELEYSGIEDEALFVESLTSLLEDQGGGSVPPCPEAVRESGGLVNGAPPPAFVEFVP